MSGTTSLVVRGVATGTAPPIPATIDGRLTSDGRGPVKATYGSYAGYNIIEHPEGDDRRFLLLS